MTKLPLTVFLLIGTLLPAQSAPPAAANPLVAAKDRLAAALTKTASLADTKFEASWAPHKKNKAAAGARPMMPGTTGGVTGSWHEDCAHYRWLGEATDQLIVAGRRTIAKDDDSGWKLRAGRFADGNSAGFLPDMQLMLQQLASWDLAVVQTGVSSLDDRPVEVVSVTLNADQVAEAVWTGLVPEALVQGDFGMRFFAAGVLGGRTAAPPPKSTIDLAITIDPARSLVQQIRARSWTKADAAGAGGVFIVQGGAGRVLNDDEEDETEDVKADGPMAFEDGLPVRPRKKLSVMDYTVRLGEHSTHRAPDLTAEQKKLLGR